MQNPLLSHVVAPSSPMHDISHALLATLLAVAHTLRCPVQYTYTSHVPDPLPTGAEKLTWQGYKHHEILSNATWVVGWEPPVSKYKPYTELTERWQLQISTTSH